MDPEAGDVLAPFPIFFKEVHSKLQITVLQALQNFPLIVKSSCLVHSSLINHEWLQIAENFIAH